MSKVRENGGAGSAGFDVAYFTAKAHEWFVQNGFVPGPEPHAPSPAQEMTFELRSKARALEVCLARLRPRDGFYVAEPADMLSPGAVKYGMKRAVKALATAVNNHADMAAVGESWPQDEERRVREKNRLERLKEHQEFLFGKGRPRGVVGWVEASLRLGGFGVAEIADFVHDELRAATKQLKREKSPAEAHRRRIEARLKLHKELLAQDQRDLADFKAWRGKQRQQSGDVERPRKIAERLAERAAWLSLTMKPR